MITPSEFIREWKGERVRFSPASVETLCIPAVSKQFLIEAGLPNIETVRLSFHEEGQPLPTLPEFLGDEYPLPPEFNRYRVIGDNYGSFICLDEEDDGKVISVETDEQLYLRGINSNVSLFAETLLLYESLPGGEAAEALSVESWQPKLLEFRQNIHRIDPWALENRDRWWVVIIEEFFV